jgi:hypothetical protein
MEKLDREKDEDFSKILTHEQIRSMMDELLEFEKKLPLFDISDSEMVYEDSQMMKKDEEDIDIVSDKSLEFEPETKKKKVKFSFKKLPKLKIKRKTSAKTSDISYTKVFKIKALELKPNEFRFGLDEKGDLVNLDLRKSKPHQPKSESKFVSKLSKINPLKFIKGRKKGGETQSSSDEKGSKGSKVKGIFGSIGKLKNAIPSRGKKEKK